VANGNGLAFDAAWTFYRLVSTLQDLVMFFCTMLWGKLVANVEYGRLKPCPSLCGPSIRNCFAGAYLHCLVKQGKCHRMVIWFLAKYAGFSIVGSLVVGFLFLLILLVEKLMW
jgi:hypothetical protein